MTLDEVLKEIEKGIERPVGEGEYGTIWETDADKKNLISALRKAIAQRNQNAIAFHEEVTKDALYPGEVDFTDDDAELASILKGEG